MYPSWCLHKLVEIYVWGFNTMRYALAVVMGPKELTGRYKLRKRVGYGMRRNIQVITANEQTGILVMQG